MITLTTAEYDALADPPAHQLNVDDVGIVLVQMDDEPAHLAVVFECTNADVDLPAFRLLYLSVPPVVVNDRRLKRGWLWCYSSLVSSSSAI